MASATRERIAAHIDTIPLLDTHEHIPDETTACRQHTSLFSFFDHYVSSDLVSAGMPREHLEAMRNAENGLTLAQRWALMEPYLPFAMTTGYGRAMRAYMADLYNIPEITRDTFEELSRRIAEAHKPGWYRHVLHERANIARALVTTWPGQDVAVDQTLFRAMPILDHYAIPGTRAELQALEQESGHAIQTLTQLMNAQQQLLARHIEKGIAGVKIFLAYRRPLLFERVSETAAARVFDRIWLSQTQDLAFEDLKPLQDFMTRRLIALAAEHRLPIQIHTGMQEGNGNYLENARPTLLNNLFMEFPDARFDIFHAGFPYTGEVAVMAKYFPNVYADLCWMHAVSPAVAARILDEWLEIIPANKILGFGGDSNYVEGAYGHACIARHVTADVLARKVAQGYFSEEEALWMAQQILHDNAATLFNLP